MKKLSVFIVIIICLSAFLTAFADNYSDLFQINDSLPNRGSVSADIEIQNFKEFDFLEQFEDYFKPYNIKSIVESLFSSKIHIDATYKTEQRKKIISVYAKAYADTPLVLNEDLQINAKAVFNIWIDMNFTNENSPYYYIMIKSPVNGKYYVFDSTAADSFKIYPSEMRKKKLLLAISDAVRENSKLLVNNGTYSLSLSDEGFKKSLKTLVDNSYNALYLYFNGSDTNRLNYSSYKQEILNMLSRTEPFSILGKSGLKAIYTFSKDKKLQSTAFDIDVETNIFKLYYSATDKEIPADPNAKKPIINADNSDIHLNFKINTIYKSNYTYYNTPSPSKDLIVDLYRDKTYSVSYPTNDKYVSPYEIMLFRHKGFPVYENGMSYLPLRAMLNSLGIPNENILWSDGTVSISGNAFVPFENLVLAENSPTMIVDNNEINLDAPVAIIDDNLCVSCDFVKKALDAKILDYTTAYYNDYLTYYTTVRIERMKPLYYEQYNQQPIILFN